MEEEFKIKAESILNREDDSLPYAYFHPETDGKLTWICGPDSEGNITSVFCMDNGSTKDKKSEYIKNMDNAKFIRQELIKAGWKKLEAPEITFTFPGEKKSRKLNRKEKRFLKKKIKMMETTNPFN